LTTTFRRSAPFALLLWLTQAGAHAQAPRHPLDPLTGQEYGQVVALLKSAGRVDDSTRYPIITLAAPEKSAVLAWRKGGALPARSAEAIVRHAGAVYEARIDLTAGAVASWKPMKGVGSQVLFEEWAAAQEAVLKHPGFVAALRKRGIVDLKKVFCAPWTMGYFDIAADRGMRLLKVGCFDLRPSENNMFGWPIEGLYASGDILGLFFHNYPSFSGQTRNAVFSRIAAEHAVRWRNAPPSAVIPGPERSEGARNP